MHEKKPKKNLTLRSIDEKLGKKDKTELIQIIKSLCLKNKKQRETIHCQKKEIQNLADNFQSHGKDLKERESSRAESTFEEGTLLPILEAIEEMPHAKADSNLRRILIDAFLNKNSRYYPLVNSFLVILILFSVICITLESVPSIMERWGPFFHWSELIVASIFAIEYIINIYVAENKLRYIFGIWGLIDLVAILPTFFGFMDLRDVKLVRTIRLIRFMRALRMIRILKLTKNMRYNYQQSLNQRVNTLKVDLEVYTTALFTIITIFSTLVYYAEQNTPNTPFSSIPATMWWCIVTITTVGYGDMYPSTTIGKLISVLTMIVGLALFGILINIIGKAMMNSLSGDNKTD